MKKRKKIILTVIIVIIIIVTILLLPIRPREIKHCSKKRWNNDWSCFCTAESNPVCWLNKQEYSNWCVACCRWQDFTEWKCSEKRNTNLLNLIKNKLSN